tara:strand:+ start:2235 stop:2444 length:210 start_codon:yes stop_codon:yes gene_type:complete
MTKSELITLLSDKFSQLVHKDAELSVKTIIDSLGDALNKGGRVEIRGFGSFSLNQDQLDWEEIQKQVRR